MKNRLKEVRKEYGYTQAGFAEALMISKSTIEAYEYGRREVTDRTVSDICDLCNVNEEWLRYGTGDKYKKKGRKEAIADLTVKLSKSNDPFYLELAKMLSEMTEEQLSQAKEAITRLYNAIEKE